jgi:hypothetical protein
MESRARKETRTAERDGLANSVEFSQAALNYKFKFFGARLLIAAKNHPFAWKIGSCSTDFAFDSTTLATSLHKGHKRHLFQHIIFIIKEEPNSFSV